MAVFYVLLVFMIIAAVIAVETNQRRQPDNAWPNAVMVEDHSRGRQIRALQPEIASQERRCELEVMPGVCA